MLDAVEERTRHDEAMACSAEELIRSRREVLVAALLHDVGHGPFSHLFERASPPVQDGREEHPKDHEDWTRCIIRDRCGEVLQAHGVDLNVVTGLIDKKNRSNLLAKDIISSQLDADRMDYLLRDSRATGARYGEFDLDWLIRALRVGDVQVRGQSGSRPRLCFDRDKAVHVVEEYIQAREFMYLQVYMHKTTRAYEAMVLHVLELAREILNEDTDSHRLECPSALRKMLMGERVSTEEYCSLDDFRVWTTFCDWSELSPGSSRRRMMLVDKVRRLVHRGRPYRTIHLRDEFKRRNAVALATELRGTPLHFSCHLDEFRDTAYRNVFYRKSHEDEEQEDRVIYLLDAQGRARPAERESEVIEAISRITNRLFRLFYDDQDDQLVARLRRDGWID